MPGGKAEPMIRILEAHPCSVKEKAVRISIYDHLTELRYDKGLDRDIIPNIHYLYDMETRPSNSRDFPDMGRLVGGIFEMEFDSTDDDDFFYQWLLSGTMNNGEILKTEALNTRSRGK